MSCNYAEGLSPYADKGVLGVPEKFDNPEAVEKKAEKLVEWIKAAKHVVIHTGAGISTAAGIPDFRGPNGVWTLEKAGKKPNIDISFNESIPTKTHMALKQLLETGYIHYIVSQNIDGLHLRSGVARKHIAELHGNMFVEQCNVCESKFVRSSATTTVGQKLLGHECRRGMVRKRACRGKMQDTILDWEDNLPEFDLELSDYHSSVADLNICLGTTLQIVPSGNLPLRCKKYGGKVVIVNLQPTKHDKKADLIINTYVDDVLEKVCKKLGVEIPEYSKEIDPTKSISPDVLMSWSIPSKDVKDMKMRYEMKNREHKKLKMKEKEMGLDKKVKLKTSKIKSELNYCDIKSIKCNRFESDDIKLDIKKPIFDTIDLTEECKDDEFVEDDDDDPLQNHSSEDQLNINPVIVPDLKLAEKSIESSSIIVQNDEAIVIDDSEDDKNTVRLYTG